MMEGDDCMLKRTGTEVEIKCGRINDAMRRYGIGSGAMRQLAKAARAEIKLGRSYLIDFEKVDAYLETLSK